MKADIMKAMKLWMWEPNGVRSVFASDAKHEASSLRRRSEDPTNLRESANNLKHSGRKLSAILIGAPDVPRNHSQ